MKPKIPFSEEGVKSTAKTQPFPLFRDRIIIFLDLTERGKPNHVVHGSIIRVSAVLKMPILL